MAPARLFTIGHSTRSLEEFLELLEREGVTHLVDVRAFPASRRHPHFNGPDLSASLAAAGTSYTHTPELGGRRKPSKDSRNTAWRNNSFRAYADYMETPRFSSALDELLTAAAREPSVIMCAEAVPWRCHRSLISDAAVARGTEVRHILDSGSQEHRLTSFAWIDGSRVRYDDATQNELFAPRSS
ncbi:MAG: DUF488 family protein [Thermoanaerobaculia bacterium]